MTDIVEMAVYPHLQAARNKKSNYIDIPNDIKITTDKFIFQTIIET